MGEIYIPFVRIEKFEPTTIAMIRVSTDGNMSKDEIMGALIELVTLWVNETERGARAWTETCNDFNIGDLFMYEDAFKEWLSDSDRPFELGILNVDFIICEDADGGEAFDRILVDRTKVRVEEE